MILFDEYIFWDTPFIFTSTASHFAFPICTNQKKSLYNHHHPVALVRIPTWFGRSQQPPWSTSYSATTNIMITIITPGCRWSTSYSSWKSWPSSTSWSQSSHQVALIRSRTWFGTAPPPPCKTRAALVARLTCVWHILLLLLLLMLLLL